MVTIKKLDATETNDVYEIIVEWRRRKSTVISSNREPVEWMAMTSDTLLVQSVIDRLTQGTHMLITEGRPWSNRPAETLDEYGGTDNAQ